MLSGCQTNPVQANKSSAPLASEQTSSNMTALPATTTDNTSDTQTSPTSTDGKYYVDMPDSALGNLSSLEKEIVEFDDFMVLTYSGGPTPYSAPAKFDVAIKKKQFNSSVQIFEEGMDFETSANPEMLGYIEALNNTGAYGKSFGALQDLEGKLNFDFDRKKHGKYKTSFWDMYETSFTLSYSQMLSGYSRYYETLGDYRRAIHFTQKAHKVKAALDDPYLPGKFDINHAITMARLSL